MSGVQRFLITLITLIYTFLVFNLEKTVPAFDQGSVGIPIVYDCSITAPTQDCNQTKRNSKTFRAVEKDLSIVTPFQNCGDYSFNS